MTPQKHKEDDVQGESPAGLNSDGKHQSSESSSSNNTNSNSSEQPSSHEAMQQSKTKLTKRKKGKRGSRSNSNNSQINKSPQINDQNTSLLSNHFETNQSDNYNYASLANNTSAPSPMDAFKTGRKPDSSEERSLFELSQPQLSNYDNDNPALADIPLNLAIGNDNIDPKESKNSDVKGTTNPSIGDNETQTNKPHESKFEQPPSNPKEPLKLLPQSAVPRSMAKPGLMIPRGANRQRLSKHSPFVHMDYQELAAIRTDLPDLPWKGAGEAAHIGGGWIRQHPGLTRRLLRCQCDSCEMGKQGQCWHAGEYSPSDEGICACSATDVVCYNTFGRIFPRLQANCPIPTSCALCEAAVRAKSCRREG